MTNKRVFWGLSSLFLLGGCQLFEGEKIPLKGERQSISTLGDLTLRVKETQIPSPLSKPVEGSFWEQPDRLSSHDVGHLAFTPSSPKPEILWSRSYSSSRSDARLLSNPIVTKDHGIFVLSHQGRIFCLDQKTGNTHFDVSIAPEDKKDESTLGGGMLLSRKDYLCGNRLWRITRFKSGFRRYFVASIVTSTLS